MAKGNTLTRPTLEGGPSGPLPSRPDFTPAGRGESYTPRPISSTVDLFAAIDVGTTKICTVLARKLGANGLEVIDYAIVPSHGLKKGNVTDTSATEAAIRQCVLDLEKRTGYRIKSAFVGVTGSHVDFENRRDRLEPASGGRVITQKDMYRTPEAATEAVSDPGRRLIHAIRISYALDGETGIRNPVGMHSREVEVETHMVTGAAAFLNRLQQTVEAAGVKVASLVLEPLASALAVLTPEEKERGAILVDIGGGTTDVVVFKNGAIYYSGVIPVGGYQFTNDIALTFNTTYEAAEVAKVKYANVDVQASALAGDEPVSLPIVGRGAELKVQRMEICQLARERAMELTRLLKLMLEDDRMGDPSNHRIVLTGGASNMSGFAALVQRGLGISVRQGMPTVRGVMPPELRAPAYSTVLGMLQWAMTDYHPVTAKDIKAEVEDSSRKGGSFFSAIIKKLSFFGRK
ncbi:MAG: cell division protein FtsA [SAR202 cluster bacterium]|nr:cell division protein FtsA [SAR202 cluster bacterium]